uniref:Uncharacterized protein n=1 Tax=viral metagenome TaxID=1070528 RepID=A0A6M3JK19_9ZZZZ
MDKELKEKCLLTDEEIDNLVSQEGCCSECIIDAQLDKAYPIIRAETLRKVGKWLDSQSSLNGRINSKDRAAFHKGRLP